MNTPAPLSLGIDLGGTKTEAIVMRDTGETLDRWRIDSPVGSYANSLQMLCQLVRDTETRFGQLNSIGIGIPGTISSQTRLVKNANSTWLIGHPLQDDLENALERTVSIANDANCFALSEATDGAGKGAPIVWGLILGTGVGSGIVVNGKVITGINGISGEWGHNPIPDRPFDAPTCYCGQFGCIETLLSGPGMVGDHQRHGGTEISPEAIVSAAQQGDDAAIHTLDRYADHLAKATAVVINVLDPDVIIVGGGLGNMSFIYETVPALWPKYVFSDTILTRLRPPKHGDSSGVRGAAWIGAEYKSRQKIPAERV